MFRLHLNSRGTTLKINPTNSNYYENFSNPVKRQDKRSNQNFKGLAMPLLGGAGTIMQWIESKGYFISFLIQDGLGMTLPRTLTGFRRDKDITFRKIL